VKSGRTLGIIGESGSGKSVTARAVMQLLPRTAKITNGTILFRASDKTVTDIAELEPTKAKMRSIRGSEIAMIFQEPMSSLTPVYSAGVHISEAVSLHIAKLIRHRGVNRQKYDEEKLNTREIAIDMLEKVGIPNAKKRVDSFPHQLSGGQRQRVMIAIALSCRPQLLIADEPTTALDVTTQAQINQLMRDLQREYGMGMLYITHDMGIIAEMADDVAVMYLGTVVERGSVEDIFYNPRHPYTRALLNSTPKFGQARKGKLETIKGMVPDALSTPVGCPFHDRCPEAIPGVCDQSRPPLTEVSHQHSVGCWLYKPSDSKEVLNESVKSA
jgi:peptide/nickel transport system ATP-binding protein